MLKKIKFSMRTVTDITLKDSRLSLMKKYSLSDLVVQAYHTDGDRLRISIKRINNEDTNLFPLGYGSSNWHVPDMKSLLIAINLKDSELISLCQELKDSYDRFIPSKSKYITDYIFHPDGKLTYPRRV